MYSFAVKKHVKRQQEVKGTSLENTSAFGFTDTCHIRSFFKMFLPNTYVHMSYFGATDTPVLDFW